MISAQAALNRLIDGNELFYDEMLDVMRQIMSGQLTPAQIAAILIGLRVKVESVSEIAAAATVMREFATPVPVARREHLVDTCGTGGDGAHTFNISTTSAFVAAAAGARVAKHGGRSVSSSSGSADVLETLGVKLNLSAGEFPPLGYMGSEVPTSITVEWSHRNRLTEDTVAMRWTEGSVTPEVGQTTTVRVVDAVDGTLEFEEAGITGTSRVLPPLPVMRRLSGSGWSAPVNESASEIRRPRP